MNKKIVEFWDDRYSSKEYIYGREVNDFLKKNTHLLKANSKVLCLAEGEGRNAVYLGKIGFDVYGVDISEKGKEKALILAKENNVKINYEVSNFNDFNFGESNWDAIVGIFYHTDKDTRVKLFNNIKKSLKNDGIFISEGYNKEQLNRNTGGPKDINMLFSSEEFEKEFINFDIILSQNIIRNVNEGSCHNGEASVFQFIAKKA